MTPLMYAGKEGWLDVVQCLVECKANVNVRDKVNQTHTEQHAAGLVWWLSVLPVC